MSLYRFLEIKHFTWYDYGLIVWKLGSHGWVTKCSLGGCSVTCLIRMGRWPLAYQTRRTSVGCKPLDPNYPTEPLAPPRTYLSSRERASQSLRV